MNKLVLAKTIFESYKYLDKIINSVDHLVMEQGVHSHSATTMDSVKSIIDLIEKKKHLLFLKNALEEGMSSLSQEQANLVVSIYVDGVDLQTYADKYNINRRTVARHIDKALLQSLLNIKNKGYDISRIENVVADEAWLCGIYNLHLTRLKSQEEEQLKSGNMSSFDRALYNRFASKINREVHMCA